MSKSLVLALATVAFVAACAKKEEVTYAPAAAPVTTEPTYTGKYK